MLQLFNKKISLLQIWGLLLSFIFLNNCLIANAQTYKIHSHNDYEQNVPFWKAYASGAASIEVDVILLNDQLYVAHEEETILPDRTLSTTYLSPIRKAFDLNIGEIKAFQLLIDVKTDAYSTLDKIVEVLEQYPDILQTQGSTQGISIVISGNRPEPADYVNYPEHIQFDHQTLKKLGSIPLEKVALISLPFERFSVWNGKGRLVEQELKKIEKTINIAHNANKPIRFWGTPDTQSAWRTFHDLGIDYINTDQPFKATAYLKTLQDRVYASSNVSDIYTPNFEIDGQPKPVRNIILLIGDGNGLAQISAGMYANNNQLTLTTLKNIGLLKTQSADDFITDSAAGASALATGQKTRNRAIGVAPDGTRLENLTEYLQQYHYLTGIVTTDHITGATPAAFYAHQSDRGMVYEISKDLSKSKLNLFIGAGKNDFLKYGSNEIKQLKSSGVFLLDSLEEFQTTTKNRVGYLSSDRGLPAVMKGRQDFLKNATKLALSYLSKDSKSFFLMVEEGEIDNGAHSNSAGSVIEEVIDFDQAIAEALKFADEHGNTLVIITADHETGGITIPQGNTAKGEVELEFETNDHTGIMVPIFAYGPHSNEFRGVYENTHVFHKIVSLIKKYQQ